MENNTKELIVLTVSNLEQKQLSERFIAELFGFDNSRIIVIPDSLSNDEHIGSGGAFFNIISNYYEPNTKLLIINSGGFSKRAPNYSVRGKAFANFYLGNKLTNLFEQIVLNGQKILSCVSSGVLICCSDILINSSNVTITENENIGFAVRSDCVTGERHGVFFCNGKKLWHYLHKKPIDEYKRYDPNCEKSGVLVDTGMVYFNDHTVNIMKSADKKYSWSSQLRQANEEFNLYPEIVQLLSHNVNFSEYINSNMPSQVLKKVREELFNCLNNTEMNIVTLDNEDFIHFGNAQEALNNILTLSDTKNTVQINSSLDKNSAVENSTVLDNVLLKSCSIGKNCMVSDIILENVEVKDNSLVFGIMLRDGSFVTACCDVRENQKDIYNDTELWKFPRFYKASSFTESLELFNKKSFAEKVSLEYCLKNADYGYYFEFQRYLADMSDYIVRSEYIEQRDHIVSSLNKIFMPIKRISCAYKRVEISLPARVNLSGTWTDAMPYCIDNGGQVVNMAITIDDKLPIKVVVEKTDNHDIEFCCDNSSAVFSFNDITNEEFSDFALHKAALIAIGVNQDTEICSGFKITTKVSDIDKGSGLGISSILLSGCIKAMCMMFGLKNTDSEVMQAVFAAEQIMGTGGGWQDQAGGFFPGLKVSTSEPGIDQFLKVETIALNESFKEFVSERLFLVPTGKRHYGRFIVNDVVNRYLEKNPDSLNGHSEICSLNSRLISSVKNNDYVDFSACINRHFELLKLISPNVSDEDIDTLCRKLLDISEAVSALGAGGGGYLLVVASKGIGKSQIEDFIHDEFPYIKSSVKRIGIYDSSLQIRCELL